MQGTKVVYSRNSRSEAEQRRDKQLQTSLIEEKEKRWDADKTNKLNNALKGRR